MIIEKSNPDSDMNPDLHAVPSATTYYTSLPLSEVEASPTEKMGGYIPIYRYEAPQPSVFLQHQANEAIRNGTEVPEEFKAYQSQSTLLDNQTRYVGIFRTDTGRVPDHDWSIPIGLDETPDKFAQAYNPSYREAPNAVLTPDGKLEVTFHYSKGELVSEIPLDPGTMDAATRAWTKWVATQFRSHKMYDLQATGPVPL